MKKNVCLFFTLFLLFSNASFCQFSFYQDMFSGGVTGSGYSPDYSGGGTGIFPVLIAPGSTIRKAYFIAGRLGNAPSTTVTLNGVPFTFDNTNMVSPVFNTPFYGGASGVHVVDVTTSINPAISSYTIVVPTQQSTSDRYNEFYLYIAYDNNTLPTVKTAIFLNDVDFAPLVNYTFNFTNPIGSSAGCDVGIAVIGGYMCSSTDADTVSINGVFSGVIYGPDINSGSCGGPIGSFYYQNNTLGGLSDDLPDFAMNASDAISNAQTVIPNNSSTVTMDFTHVNPDNSLWAVIFAYGACCTITPDAGPDASICSGGNTSLNATGGTTYSWLPVAGLSNPNIANPVASPLTTTTYTVNAISGGCTGSDTVRITVNSFVTNNPNPVCSPNTVDLTTAAITAGSTPGGTFSYWNNSTATSPLISPNTVSASGTYYIKYINGACTIIDSVTVTINPSPNLITTNPPAVCSPGTVDITSPTVTAGSTGGGVLSYWMDAAASIPLSSPNAITTNGTYYIETTSASCTDIASVIVTINPVPNLIITTPPAVCVPATVDITSPAVTSGSTGAGVLSYWMDAAATIPLSSPNAITVSGIYYIISTSGSCSDTASVTVTINPALNLITTNPPAVCFPGTVDITSPAVTTGSTGAGVLSYWTDAAATIPLSSPNAITASGTYYIKSTNGACTDIASVTVTINPLPVATFTATPLMGCMPLCVNFTDASTPSGAIISWNWNLDDATTDTQQNPNHCYLNPGTYTISLSVTSNNNCTATTVIPNMINVSPWPVAGFIAPPITSINNPTVSFQDISTHSTTWNWDFGDDYSSSNTSTLQNPNHTYSQPGNYCVTLIAGNGFCADTTILCVIIDAGFTFYIPNSFSPNGDGINDDFIGKGYNIKDFDMTIYDRWGNLIFYGDDISKHWDGKNNGGDLVQEDVYVYVIHVKDILGEDHKYIGTVTVVK